MGTVRIADEATTPWMIARKVPIESDDDFEIVPEDDTERSSARYFHPGGVEELQMFEVRLPPDRTVDVHAHDNDEIVYVLSGEMHLGARRLGPGASAYIPGSTLYGFRSGPDGLHFLNFRACQDRTFYKKEEFLERTGRRTR